MSMIIDGTNGLTFNNATTQASAGCVLQVVQAYTSTQSSSANNTWIDSTLTATITPKFSNSKILVVAQQNGLSKSAGSSQGAVSLRLVRDSTPLGEFSKYGTYTNTAMANNTAAGFTYLDSPATTSATIYKTQFCALTNVGTAYVQDSSTVSSITLLEIAG
jgi:hypothetical protein